MSITLKFKKFEDIKPKPGQEICYFNTKYNIYGFLYFDIKHGTVEISLEELDSDNFPTENCYFIDNLEELKEINFKYKLLYVVNKDILSDSDYWMPINYFFNKINKKS